MKNFWESKTVWMNVVLTIMGISTLISESLTKDTNVTVPGILMIVAGICGVILRVWFTDQPINK